MLWPYLSVCCTKHTYPYCHWNPGADSCSWIVQNVASISAGNDVSVGEMIAEALDKVGSDGVLSIESSSSLETVVEVQEGMGIDRGYISPQFVTNQAGFQPASVNAC